MQRTKYPWELAYLSGSRRTQVSASSSNVRNLQQPAINMPTISKLLGNHTRSFAALHETNNMSRKQRNPILTSKSVYYWLQMQWTIYNLADPSRNTRCQYGHNSLEQRQRNWTRFSKKKNNVWRQESHSSQSGRFWSKYNLFFTFGPHNF
jgi:hypothetical protein